MAGYKVTFLPAIKEVVVSAGTTIKDAAAAAGLEIESPCGGKGTCGKCLVKVTSVKGAPNRRDGWINSCQAKVEQDITVEIPQTKAVPHRKSLLNQSGIQFTLNPGILKVKIELRPSSLENQAADATRLLDALSPKAAKLKLEALRALPAALRQGDNVVTAVIYNSQVIAVETGSTEERLFGLAVDIGTTTIVAELVDLSSGKTLATASTANPQRIYGADVISRINFAADHSNGLEELRSKVVQAVNLLTDKLAAAAGVTAQEIYQAAIAGNTTMNHLFVGLDPSNLGLMPFIPVVADALEFEAKELGLMISPHGPVFILPNIAGFVGGDTVGVIISTGIQEAKCITLAVDIGTNGEMVLSTAGRLMVCSTAAGPAFEGANISCGMSAVDGAIEGVYVDNNIHLKVISSVSPEGVCGSGLLDAAAGLVRSEVIDLSGRIIGPDEAVNLPPSLKTRIGENSDGRYFTLYEDDKSSIIISQKDIRELQLAKAAIRAGIDTLLEQAGVNCEDLDQILLAGTFGSYINIKSALAIGLLPPIPPEKIIAIGNAAGAGAKLALVSNEMRQYAAAVARQAEHIELSSKPEFQNRFINNLQFSRGE